MIPMNKLFVDDEQSQMNLQTMYENTSWNNHNRIKWTRPEHTSICQPVFWACGRSSPSASLCCVGCMCRKTFGTPNSWGLWVGRWTQTTVRCRRWWRGRVGADASGAPQISYKYPLNIHSKTHSQNMSWFLAAGWAEQGGLCET